MNNKLRLMASAGLMATMSFSVAAANTKLHVYNWSDYIAEDTIANFEKETGIEVVYDVFDSNEVLEAKLLTGNSGFDLVVPSSDFLGRQAQAGAFQELDRSKLSNYGNLDPKLMAILQDKDPGNKYAVPYLWGTTGLGYNADAIAKIFGEDFEVNSWDLVFKPELISKLDCGVAFLNAPTEIIPAAMHYLGMDPNSTNPKDVKPAEELLMKVRPYITYFHSSQFINDLANGDICVAVGWSGDILQAADRADEADNGITVEYVIPGEGTLVWFDLMAIPRDARNVDAAHQFIDYLMRPDVMAEISNYVWYANAIPSSKEAIDEEVTTHPGIYPPEEVQAKLWGAKITPPKMNRALTSSWNRIKKGL
ncbi:polyamine ABC transporter substrate-binding protein [Ferrimonas balearica]|uniref:polyamine ABC transporter substrate-binding protein n=1 Tax=Ferrimonas balearica TaxID=44012 RepID=UPI001C995F8D|nr:polyamine ABC transporter substrate-binding protein [Ferrimonas balearica]MBY5990821.1 polyamine ABC transporter substrate-binding protein [Ferrimonas balearica]